MPTIDIKEYGAIGDGISDDFAAIQRAVKVLQPGDKLYFPSGTYCVKTKGTLAKVEGISDLTVHFAPHTILLMDNLDEQGLGSGHAFDFRGPTEGLMLDGLHIRWKTNPSRRSKGDGIRIDGPYSPLGPSAQRTIKKIFIKNCCIENAPQTGMVLMGCSEIVIDHIVVLNTHADGVHLNACQYYTISNIEGRNLGDDNVALVTYYRPFDNNYALGNPGGPYAQPNLGEWSNYRGTIKNVRTSEKTGANGLRIAGALNVSIEDIQASKKKAAIIVDAGKKGGTFGWEYQASQQIVIQGVDARDCHVGVHIMTYNASPQDMLFWNFDVFLDNIILESCTLDNLLVEKCGGVVVNNIQSCYGRIRVINISDVSVNNLRSQEGSVIIHGLKAFADNTLSDQKYDQLINLRNISVFKGNIQLENAFNVKVGRLATYQSKGNTGIVLANVEEASIESLVSVMAERYGIMIINCQHLTVDSARIEATAKNFIPIEVGGGTVSSVTRDIRFEKVVYQNPWGKLNLRFQQGPYAPRKISILIEHHREQNDKIVSKHYQLD